ncbi:MAG: hypothetical protein MJ182_08405 [Treponema sp.]|nr:hypothetical protein [Treponema sp.]
MNKKTVLKVIFLILVCGKIFAESNKVQISQVKIVIDDYEFSWKEDGLSVENENNGNRKLRLLPETVLSFTNLKPGKSISLKNLEREVCETELRIRASGLVYSAKAVIVPARKNPEKRTVLITVKSGFFPRFGGGGYYGVYGRAGLSGKRMEVLGYAGWNVNGAAWKYENAFDTPLILGTSFFWDGPAAFLEDGNNSTVKVLGTAGCFLGAGNRLCVDVNADYSFGKNFEEEKFFIKPYLKCEKYFSEIMWSEFCTQVILNPIDNENYFKSLDSICSVNWTPVSFLTLAASAGGGIGNCNLSEKGKGFSSNNCFSNMVIRSGYNEEDLSGSNYLYSAFETRWNAKMVSFSSVIKMELQPFAFLDLAIIEGEMKEAVGGGIRILFDNPVFAYFTFCYGMNFMGKGKFTFVATKGF